MFNSQISSFRFSIIWYNLLLGVVSIQVFGRFFVELFRLPFRYTKAFPVRFDMAFGQENQLTNVIRVVRELPIDGLKNSEWLASYRNGSFEIRRTKWSHSVKENLPTNFPAVEEMFTRIIGSQDELGVSAAVGLLTIGSQKISPS